MLPLTQSVKQHKLSSMDYAASPNTRTYLPKNGNTTRIIDYIIQMLFAGYIVIVKDHFKYGEDYEANLILYRKVIRRIQVEHIDVIREYRLVGNEDGQNLELQILE